MTEYQVTTGRAFEVPSGGTYAPGQRFNSDSEELAVSVEAGLVSKIEATSETPQLNEGQASQVTETPKPKEGK